MTSRLRRVLDYHDREERKNNGISQLKNEIERLRGQLQKLQDHPLVIAEGGTCLVDRALRVINKLSEASWYWDDNNVETAYNLIELSVGCYDVGDIVKLRPLRELPSVYVLKGRSEHQVFATKEEAETEALKGMDSITSENKAIRRR